MAGTCRDWAWDAVRDYLRTHGKQMAQSALRGDALSMKVWKAYLTAAEYQAQDGSPMNLTLRDALTDYVIRELTITDREKLAGDFGHRVEDAKPDELSKIILPRERH